MFRSTADSQSYARMRQAEHGLHPLPCPADVPKGVCTECGHQLVQGSCLCTERPEAPDMSNAAFDGDRPASENCEEETCPEGCACPTCGENRIDYLVWIGPDYEEVECATCGRIYNPDDPLAHVPAEIAATVLAFERMGERYEAGDAPGYREA